MRSLLVVVVSAFLCALLAACGNANQTPPSPAPTPIPTTSTASQGCWDTIEKNLAQENFRRSTPCGYPATWTRGNLSVLEPTPQKAYVQIAYPDGTVRCSDSLAITNDFGHLAASLAAQYPTGRQLLGSQYGSQCHRV